MGPVILVQRGDDTMAAHAYSGPVAVQEGAPPPAVGASRPAAEGATDAAHGHAPDSDAPAPEKDEDDEGAMWDTASIYEEILDEVEAFEYSGNGTSGRLRATHCSLCANTAAQV
jgi:NAD+-dependent protein deacetylase SIR2